MEVASLLWPDEPLAPLTGAILAMVAFLAQPAALAVLMWGGWFARRRQTRAYGLSVIRWGAWGWLICFVSSTAWWVIKALRFGYSWRAPFSPEGLLLNGILASAGFFMGGMLVARWDYGERFEPPSVRL